MSAYRLHCFPQSGNSYKVALMLQLTGCEWEPVFVDFFNGETRSAPYRSQVNEMGEAPVLEHAGGKLTQSGVILDYLSEQTGMFRPADAHARRECWRWILYDNHKLTNNLAMYRFLRNFGPQPADQAVLAFLNGRRKSALQIIDKHLSSQPFIVGKEPTVADLSLVGYLYYPAEEHGIDIPASYPAIGAWLGRIKALPGWKGPYELIPGKP